MNAHKKRLPQSVSIPKIYKECISFLKYTYLVSVLVLSVITIIEIKHIYAIDLFPGVDTPFDNIYFALKNQ
jgi:hypothetical protein